MNHFERLLRSDDSFDWLCAKLFYRIASRQNKAWLSSGLEPGPARKEFRKPTWSPPRSKPRPKTRTRIRNRFAGVSNARSWTAPCRTCRKPERWNDRFIGIELGLGHHRCFNRKSFLKNQVLIRGNLRLKWFAASKFWLNVTGSTLMTPYRV